MNVSSAFDIFNSVLNDTSTDTNNTEVCLISGTPLDDTRVTLPCNHTFNYLPLLNDLISFSKTHYSHYNSCPYCRSIFYGLIPYRPDISNISRKRINIPVSGCFIKHECMRDGCVRNATVPIGNKYACIIHYKGEMKLKQKRRNTSAALENVVHSHTKVCNAILKSGKRKGEQCGAKTTTEFCKRHTNP